jgi:hypothetical protein
MFSNLFRVHVVFANRQDHRLAGTPPGVVGSAADPYLTDARRWTRASYAASYAADFLAEFQAANSLIGAFVEGYDHTGRHSVTYRPAMMG